MSAELTQGVYKIESNKEERTENYWKKYCEGIYREAKDVRYAKYDKSWLKNYAYYKGWHNLQFQESTGRMVWGKETFCVNLIQPMVRAIRGAVTKYSPTWDIDGLPYGQLNPEEERMLGDLMVTKFEDLDMKTRIKEVVLSGMLYSLGIAQYGWGDTKDGLGDVYVDVLDPFDVYFDPVATAVENCRYIIKVVRKPVETVKNNPVYKNTDSITADNKYSSSEYKERAESVSGLGSLSTSEDGTVLLFENWRKERDEQGNDVIRIITTCNGNILRNEVTPFREFPFVVYKPDVNVGELYGEGWIKNVVPINKAIDELEASILEFNKLFSKGKYLKIGDTNVRSVTNENGQVITVDSGGRFEQMDMKPMSGTPFNQLANLNRYFQDIGGAQEAFMGRAPQGVTAGIAYEQLVASNMNAISDLIDNLEIFLSKLGEEILNLMYANYDVSRIYRFKNGGNIQEFGVVGQGVELGEVNGRPIISLPERFKVRVRIVSGVGFTKSGRQETMFKLREGGDLDRKSLLDELNLNSEEVIARLQEEQMPPVPPVPPMPQMPEGMPQGMPPMPMQ